MVTKPKLHHVGVQCKNKDQAIVFYQKLLGLNLLKSFILDKELSSSLFNVSKDVEVLVFQNETMYVEVFIDDDSYDLRYNHTCIVVPNIDDLITQCELFNIESFSVQKGEKRLWFVKDFSGNLFELKGKI